MQWTWKSNLTIEQLMGDIPPCQIHAGGKSPILPHCMKPCLPPKCGQPIDAVESRRHYLNSWLNRTIRERERLQIYNSQTRLQICGQSRREMPHV
jgi:hypothetical protein